MKTKKSSIGAAHGGARIGRGRLTFRQVSALLLIFALVASVCFGPDMALADDPGEDISLILRYPFAGDAKDTQRDQRDGTLSGSGATFVTDDTFGAVLDLSGGSKGSSAVVIPGETLVGVESITVATWIYVRADTAYTRVFDFGQNATRNFYLAARYGNYYSARITTGGSGAEQSLNGPGRIAANQWLHIAVTIDAATDTMNMYRDGALVGSREITDKLADVVSQAGGAANLLYIGRSQYGDPDLNARLSDFRIYSRALSLEEIAAARSEKFTDEQVVASDLGIVTNSLGALTNRTEDFSLPTSTLSGSAVEWTSSAPEWLNAATGAVTRPPSAYESAAAPVTLSVRVSKGDAAAALDLEVTILRLPSDQDIVGGDAEALNIQTGMLTESIVLPTSGQMGAAISWISSNPNYIDGNGAVTRPPVGAPNEAATLTATISFGSASQTKSFDVAVKAQTDALVLVGVTDIVFASPADVLPKLPYYLPASYLGGKAGPAARVSWPAPTNANAYRAVGAAEISGAVHGTDFQPTAKVSVVGTENIVNRQSLDYSAALYGDDVFAGGSPLSATAALMNSSGEALSARLYLATYDSSGRMNALESAALSLDAGDDGAVTVTMGGDRNTGAYAKAFLWDDATFIPLAESLEINASVELPSLIMEKFDLSEVSLDNAADGSQTVFQKNTANMISGLLGTNDDRFLYMFRQTFGVEQPAGAQALGGWDTETTKLRGHATGHYLSALAQAYSVSANDAETQARFKTKIDYMVDNLYAMSKLAQGNPWEVPIADGKTAYTSELTAAAARKDYENWGTGFISAYPPDQFIMLESYATYGSGNAQIWAPYYTLHKILAGLVDCYVVAGNEKALEIAKNMGLWVYERLSRCTQAQLTRMWGIYIAGEYGGMNETLAKLFQLTGDERLLRAAVAFDNYGFFFGTEANGYTDGLANNVDTIRTRHANQHLPQIIGSLAIYDGSRDRKYFDVADNFWEKLINSYTYSLGGNGGLTSNSECFVSQPDALYGNGLPASGSKDANESCATYNSLKLSTQLFLHNPDAKYMDYYERALYNQMLGTINPSNAGTIYFFPVTGGAMRSYGNSGLTGFSCCNGTGLETHTKYADSIYTHKGDEELYVNLYIPSTVKWNDSVTVRQSTNYPYADSTEIQIIGDGEFALRLRVPYWATGGFDVYVNGVRQGIAASPSSYITLNRTWNSGDVVRLAMPMDFHLFETVNQPNIASVFYGPILLAGAETAALATYRPLTLDAADLGSSITGDPSTLIFETNGRTLQPLYAFGTSRYSTYFNVTLER